MIVSDQELLNFLQFDGTDEEALIVLAIRNGAEKWISHYCNRIFEYGTFKEYYDGGSSPNIFLKNTPVDTLTTLYIGKDSTTNLTTDEYEFYPERGLIVLNSGKVTGRNSIYAEYTAGYTIEDMPADLQLAVKILTKVWNEKRKNDSMGVTNYSVADMSTVYEDFVPTEVLILLSNYRRIIAL